MAMLQLPDELAERLRAEAARRRMTVEQVATEVLSANLPGEDSLEDFIGVFDSGDEEWAGTDTHELRAEAAARRSQ